MGKLLLHCLQKFQVEGLTRHPNSIKVIVIFEHTAIKFLFKNNQPGDTVSLGIKDCSKPEDSFLDLDVVDIKRGSLDVDTSSYHCNIVRHIPLDSIDSSLAIGFYCKDKSDFDDFCSRALELIDQSNGAPLFTISETRISPKSTGYQNTSINHISEALEVDLLNELSSNTPENVCAQEDDWQLL